jgi:hypothetical protein
MAELQIKVGNKFTQGHPLELYGVTMEFSCWNQE